MTYKPVRLLLTTSEAGSGPACGWRRPTTSGRMDRASPGRAINSERPSDVRFGADIGLKSDMASCPLSAKN
jgi:hypothetical protein